jgi:hypothetical protein
MITTAVLVLAALVLGMLLFRGWSAAFSVLLANPKTRAAGFVVLVAPLVLIAVAAAFWWFSGMGVPQREMAWQPSRVARTADRGYADVDNVAPGHASSSPIHYDDETGNVVEKGANVAPAPRSTSESHDVRLKLFVLAVPLLGALAALLALISFPKTRAAGMSLVAVGTLLLAPLGAFWLAGSMQAESHWQSRTATVSMDSAGYPTARKAITRKTDGVTSLSPSEVKKSREEWLDSSFPQIAEHYKAMAERDDQAAPPPAAAKKGPAETKAAATPQPPKTDAKPAVKPPATPPAAPAKGTPAWVNSPPRVVGDAYQMAIVVGPWKTRHECDIDLPKELQKALDHYAEMCLGEPTGARIPLSYDFLRQQVVKEQWQEEIELPVAGQMTQLHVLLRFDHTIKDRLLEERQRGIITARLWMGGAGLAAVLWLLAVVYGYLRVDLATGGAYRGRLRFAAALAILGPVAAAMLAVA